MSRFGTLSAMFRGGWNASFQVLSCVGCAAWLVGCGTVDLGDNFVPPAVALDEDFFYCNIQPDVLTQHSCASGGPGEAGMCHSERSALRLLPISEANLPICDDDGVALDPIPLDATDNLEAIRFTVQGNPQSSPLFLRPVNRASHPRQIFPEDDPAAQLIIDWISQGGS